MDRSNEDRAGIVRVTPFVDFWPAELSDDDQHDWFMDDEFRTPLPQPLSEECARVYGRGPCGVDFAQGLASFLAIDESRERLMDCLSGQAKEAPTEHAPLADEELAALDYPPDGFWCQECESATDVPRLIADLRAARTERDEAWERYDAAIGIMRDMRAALGRAPEDCLKGDDEAWAVYTGDSGELPPDYEAMWRAARAEVERLRAPATGARTLDLPT